MKQDRQRKPNADTSFANTIESFHLVFAVAPIIALIITTLLGKDIHLIIELILIIIVIVVNFFILLRKRATEEGEELSLFYTFWTNNLLPNQSGDEQTYKVTIAVIEDGGNTYFQNDIQNQFKTEYNLEKLKSLLSNEPRLKNPLLKQENLETLVLEKAEDHRLTFQPMPVNSQLKDDVEQLQKDFKKSLDSELENPTAVIVVRTSNLEDKPWVYHAVNSWAYQHSEVPILFAKDRKKDFPENELAKKFLWIPDDPKSLPWRLLQRAKNRAKVWRIQATYNRAMVWNIFYISLLCIYVGAILIKAKKEEFSSRIKVMNEEFSTQIRAKNEGLSTQKSRYNSTMSGMDEAIKTEKYYRSYTSKKEDRTLSVSYWYGYTDKPYIFATTEIPYTTTQFEKDYETIIGCGFVKPNHVIEGRVVGAGKDAKTKVVAYDNYGDIVPMPECQLLKLPTSEIKSIVCATHNDMDSPQISNRTVGICVFTQDEKNNIFGKENRKFLIERTRQFHKDFISLLENNDVISLAERKGKTPPTHGGR